MAAATKTPEIALEKAESEGLAKAVADVARFYPTAIDAKTIAWVNLATCMGLTYGPRVYLIRKRLADEAEERHRRDNPQPLQTFQG